MRSWPVLGRTALVIVAIATVSAPATAQKPAPVEDVSSFPHRTPDEERRALHVPPGFEVQLVAAEPDIQKPLNLAFDDHGRLWVTDTVEYPYTAKEGTRPRDTVKILSDFGADGKARSIQTFADGLNIPIGLIPLLWATAALVHGIPDIFLLRDTDGDGRADAREVVYGVFGHRDTHGMTNAFTWGFDGWIYACHGYSIPMTRPSRGRTGADFHELRQYLPDEARRLARRVRHAWPGQPVRPGVRPAREPLLVRLPQPAGLPASPRRLVPQLRQAARWTGIRARDGHLRPRLDRHRRHFLLRGRPVPRGLSRHDLRRQRRHQPDQPRQDRVAWLDAQGDRAARLRLERGQLVPARGARVFEKSCANCHQLEGKGARVGPQLDGIGSRGLERLLEDVLDPNRNVDQSFRVTNLALQSGQIVSGLLLREEGQVLIVADSQGKEVRVPKTTVEERSTAQLSPMPANMADQIPEPDFNDLMSYLLKHRDEKAPR